MITNVPSVGTASRSIIHLSKTSGKGHPRAPNAKTYKMVGRRALCVSRRARSHEPKPGIITVRLCCILAWYVARRVARPLGHVRFWHSASAPMHT